MIIEDGVLIKVEDEDIHENGEFIINDHVTSIGPYAFMNCTNLKKVKIIGVGDTLINDGAFLNCSSLTHVEIFAKKTLIGPCAFMNCTNLESVKIHGDVESFGTHAFWACNKLQSITIDGSIPSSDEYQCVFLDDIKLVKDNNCKSRYILGSDSSQSANPSENSTFINPSTHFKVKNSNGFFKSNGYMKAGIGLTVTGGLTVASVVIGAALFLSGITTFGLAPLAITIALGVAFAAAALLTGAGLGVMHLASSEPNNMASANI